MLAGKRKSKKLTAEATERRRGKFGGASVETRHEAFIPRPVRAMKEEVRKKGQ